MKPIPKQSFGVGSSQWDTETDKNGGREN